MSSHKKLLKRDHGAALSVSVVVPCSHVHVQHLSGLVAALHAQTRKPDQIVLAISGCEASQLPKLNAEIVHSREPCTAGSNRNRGSSVARGDVVIYQDADDLPHPQRVEIVAALFEKYHIDHLLHFYSRDVAPPKNFSVKKAAKQATYRAALGMTTVANGNPAIARSLLSSVRWPEYSKVGEDVEFNAMTCRHTKRTAIVELPLLTYRQNLSSFRR